MILFLIPALLAIALALSNYLIYRFLSRNLAVNKFKKTIKFILLSTAILQILYTINLRINLLPNFLSNIGAIAVGYGFFLFFTLLIYEILNIPFKRLNFNKERRRAIKFIFDLSIIIFAVGSILKGFINATSKVSITPYKIYLEKLKAPISLAILTDIHIGKFLTKDYLIELVKKVNALEVDFVLLVGDISDLKGDQILQNLYPLNNLKSKFGTFLTLGNHEYYHGVDEVVKQLSKLDLKIMHNQNIQIGGINLSGVYDLAGIKFGKFIPDFDKALSNLDTNLPTILMSHQPKSANFVDKKVDLIVSGHTHAGQIFPFGILAKLDQKYLYGLYDIDENQKILVSSGAGFWGPPIRILTKSEIVFLQLLPKDKNEL